MSAFENDKFWSDVRVGLITFLALSLAVLGITFAGGDKGLLFTETTGLTAHLVDVGGLKKGAAVTMGGMPIGKVNTISFTDNSASGLIQVSMQIRQDVRDRIKLDSVPSVKTQGMMGDRYVDVSRGSEGAAALSDGQALVGKEATEFDETIRQASAVLSETRKLLVAVNEQQGTVGQFFYDEQFYQSLIAISEELHELIKDFKQQPRKYIKFSIF